MFTETVAWFSSRGAGFSSSSFFVYFMYLYKKISSFCTSRCALAFARGHAGYKFPLLLLLLSLLNLQLYGHNYNSSAFDASKPPYPPASNSPSDSHVSVPPIPSFRLTEINDSDEVSAPFDGLRQVGGDPVKVTVLPSSVTLVMCSRSIV